MALLRQVVAQRPVEHGGYWTVSAEAMRKLLDKARIGYAARGEPLPAEPELRRRIMHRLSRTGKRRKAQYKYTYYQVVASKQSEVDIRDDRGEPIFFPGGKYYTFIPDPNSSIVRDRLRNMTDSGIGWVWNMKTIGIRAQLFAPTRPVAGELEEVIGDVAEGEPIVFGTLVDLLNKIPGAQWIRHGETLTLLVYKEGTSRVSINSYPEAIFQVPQLEDFVFNYWVPRIMLPPERKHRGMLVTGLFPSMPRANIVARLFGIDVNPALSVQDALKVPEAVPAELETAEMRYRKDLEKVKRLVDAFEHRLNSIKDEEERDRIAATDLCIALIKPNFAEFWQRLCKDLGLAITE
jgi:hypothetical protein